MGKCIYCGNSAGLFRNTHRECEKLDSRKSVGENTQARKSADRLDGRQQIILYVENAIRSKTDLSALLNNINTIESTKGVSSYERTSLLAQGWSRAVDAFLEDGVLDRDEEASLLSFTEHFGLSQSQVNEYGALEKTVKAGILRDILEGELPNRISVTGTLPFNYQAGEQLIWAFKDTTYLEDRTKRQFVGRSHGISVRVMKGVYYRTSSFKGHPVEHTERQLIDRGWLGLTNKNIYFGGPQKSMRVPYSKIVSFEPFADGIGIMRDAATAKPQIFITGDGWFTYNLAMNLSQFAANR